MSLQFVWNRLLAIVEDQAQTLMRTAFSTVVREAGDLSTGVFNTRGEMLAQAVTGTPGHVNSMARAVRNFLEVFPLLELDKGDVLVTNDPWLATGHLNDFTVVTPVFYHEKAVALFASTSHIADVGGRGFGPDANEVFEEGICVPISRLFKRGELNDTLMQMIKSNVRDPITAEGDLYSLTTCNAVGVTSLLRLFDELDIVDPDRYGDEILRRSKETVENDILALRDGSYTNAMVVDGYDEPIEIRCALTITDRHIDIDFAGTSGVSSWGINVPMPYTEAYASFGVRCLVAPDVPNNEGSLRTMSVRAPEGCILNAQPPSAVSARHALGQMLPDVVIGCLAPVFSGQVPAEGSSCIWNPVFRNYHRPTGNEPIQRFVINPIFNGGTGARADKDGLSTTAFPSGVRTTSTEVNEVTSPLVFWQREYIRDSGGDGRFRGGLGQKIEIEHRTGSPFVLSKMFDRVQHAARGRDGGSDGTPGRVYLRSGQALRGKGTDVVPAGDALILETPGGGGSGDVSLRPRAKVEADLAADLITR